MSNPLKQGYAKYRKTQQRLRAENGSEALLSFKSLYIVRPRSRRGSGECEI